MGLKDQLESAGYDTSSLNEQDILGKLEKAGYDTTPLKQEVQKPSQTDQLASQIQSLKSQGVDPSVVNVQEQKLKMLQGGQELPPSLGPTSEFFNKTGENVATNAAQQGQNPYLAAAKGTAIAMAPQLAAGAESLASVPETAASIANLGKAAGQGLKTLGKRLVMGPDTEQAISMRNELASLPGQQTAKEAALEELRKQAGSGIESLRNQYNVPQKLSQLELPKDVNDFADTLKSLEARRPEDLAKTMGLDGLMKLRDTAKMTLESGVSKTQAAFIKRGISAIDDAVEVIHPAISEAYQNYGTVQQASEALPGDVATKKAALLNALRQSAPSVATEKALRRGAGLVAGGGGLAGAGLAALKRLGIIGGQ